MLLSMYVSTFTHTRMDLVVIRCYGQEAIVMRTTLIVCVKFLPYLNDNNSNKMTDSEKYISK